MSYHHFSGLGEEDDHIPQGMEPEMVRVEMVDEMINYETDETE